MAQGFDKQRQEQTFDEDEFKRDRLEALLSLDKKKVVAYARKWGAEFPTNDDSLLWAAVHRARVQLPELPETARIFSRKWLVANGFKSGEVA